MINFLKKITKEIKYSIQRFKDFIVRLLINRTFKVNHKNTEMYFYTPNWLTYYRAYSFSEKEPETLKWIEQFEPNSVFWDIGANVGLYSIYAAKKGHQVVSFEPSVFNLELLARNLFLNHLSENVQIIPLALNSENAFAKMNHTSLQWGGALSTFGKEFGSKGTKLDSVFSYLSVGSTMDYLTKFLFLPSPKYIKIDVDGIEHLILKGGIETLRKTKEVLIEIQNSFEEQKSTCEKILHSLHFKLIDHGTYMGEDISVNQIWRRE